MLAKGKVWVLAYWQIELVRLPVLGEASDSTDLGVHAFKGFQGERNYRMLDAGWQNTCLCQFPLDLRRSSHWPSGAGRSGSTGSLSNGTSAGDGEDFSSKIKIPEGGVAREAFKVCRHHLDTNHHVNNAQYIDMAQEYIPKDWKIARVRAEYKSQAVLGDVICPVISAGEDYVTVDLRGAEGRSFAVVEFC